MTAAAKEIELLEKSLNGDTNAFELIVSNYQELVCAITYSGVADIHRSEELAQQAFINAWSKLSHLKDLSKFRPWLCSIARNLVKSFIRTKKRDIIAKAKPMENINDTAADESSPLESAIKREHAELVSDAIGQIPEKYREPLVLYYRQRLSIKQIAESLDLSEGNAKKRLQRGRKMVKEQLNSIFEETLSTTGPKKAFTTAVMASVAGIALKGTGAAAAAAVTTTAGTATTTGASITAVMSTITAKVITTAAAVLIIGIGAVITYKQITEPDQSTASLPAANSNIDAAGLGNVKENIKDNSTKKAIEDASIDTAGLSGNKNVQGNLTAPAALPAVDESTLAEDVEFEFKPRGVLSGVFTDVDSQEPIEGLEISIISSDYSDQPSQKTDSNGMYFFSEIKKDSLFKIRLKTNEYITEETWKGNDKSIKLAKNLQIVKHYELKKGNKVNITAVDEDGNPIKDVNFYTAYVLDDMGRGPSRGKSSDKKGQALIGGLKPAEYMVSASHHDYALNGQKVAFDGYEEIKNVVFVMQKGISIEGFAICSDGLAASGWKVAPEPVWWHSVNCAYHFPIDEDGSFTLEHVLPGEYKLTVFVPIDGMYKGLWSTKMQLPSEDGVVALDIPKASPHGRVSISGTIKLSGGKIERSIWLYADDGGGNTGDVTIGKDEKNFTIGNLVPGVYKINYYINGKQKTLRNIKAPSEGVVIEVSIKKKGSLAGKVIDKEGKAVTRFKVMVYGARSWQEVENPGGVFEIQADGDKCRRVVIKADGFASKISQEIYPDAKEPAVISLGDSGLIEGTVIDEKGKPVKEASISYRYRRSRDEGPEGKYITVTDPNGMFVIEDDSGNSDGQWYVISHPDYAPQVKQIKTEQGVLTETVIVLKKGGTIEGYVYDSYGKPLADTVLEFMDEGHYGYWKENRARLGSVTTDSKGFYRIASMPEKLCYGFRHEPDDKLGVVCTTILPISGETMRMDFGGKSVTTGRLVRDGKPVPNVKLLLQGNTVGNETTFIAYARTDSNGRYSFWGIPSGLRYVYWSIPGLRNWAQWSEIGRFYFESGVDMDLGDFEIDLAEITVRLNADNTNEGIEQYNVRMQRYDEKVFYGSKAGKLLPRSDVNDPYVFSSLATGKYEFKAYRDGYPTMSKVFEIKKGKKKIELNLKIPAGDASLSGEILPSDRKAYQYVLLLRSLDSELSMKIKPEADWSYKIENLPAGDYIIGRTWVALSRQSNIKEVSLKAGENKRLSIKVNNAGNDFDGYLLIAVVTEEGLPLAGAKAWLESGTDIINPHFDNDKGKSFAGDPGEYTLCIEYPGYTSVRQRVSVKSKKRRSMQEILKLLVITMTKEEN